MWQKILKAAYGKQQITHKGIPIRLSTDFQWTLCRLEESGRTYLKWWKRKTYNQDCSPQQGSSSDLTKKSNALQISKSSKNSAPPNKFTTNTKGTSLSKKHRWKIIKKMVIGTYILIITLNVNVLNAPTTTTTNTDWLNGHNNKTYK